MSDLNQNELWAKVNALKHRVRQSLGTPLSHEFRSTQVYQAFTGLCGEAQMAYDDQELDQVLITLLEEYADKVITRWNADAVR
jgi:hypothetical protein